MQFIAECGIEYGLQFGLGFAACQSKNPVFPQFPKLPLYKEILQFLTKLRKNERNAKGRNKHFLNFCSQIITFSIFLIIFVHRTPNVGQLVAKNDMAHSQMQET